MDLNFQSKPGKFVKEILDFYIPLLVKVPKLRDDPSFMKEEIKATGKSGLTDVATKADIYMQEEIKKNILKLHPEWEFWGEEGDDANKDIESNKDFLFITDPIEGTNNFRFKEDDYWGSVIALVDLKTNEPVLGIVAQVVKKRLFLAVKGEGVNTIQFDKNGVKKVLPIISSSNELTYNNSPHFEDHYLKQVDKFFSLGNILPDDPKSDEIEKERKSVMIDGKKFIDVECGNLEPVLFDGGIMFKTNIEIASSFVIINELGGKITDAKGGKWSMSIKDSIFARKESDWKFLKKIYDKTAV